jgi:hypothetical protein
LIVVLSTPTATTQPYGRFVAVESSVSNPPVVTSEPLADVTDVMEVLIPLPPGHVGIVSEMVVWPVRLQVAAPPVAHHCCRFCDNKLPQGRAITFCPFCGMDLTKRQCPACSTELEVNWRYCVTCGRQE